jgi:hypothetical protein
MVDTMPGNPARGSRRSLLWRLGRDCRGGVGGRVGCCLADDSRTACWAVTAAMNSPTAAKSSVAQRIHE